MGPKTTTIIWVRAETPYPLDLRLEAGLRPVTPNKSFIQRRRGKVKVHVYVLMQLKFYGTFPKPGCDVILPMPAIAAYAEATSANTNQSKPTGTAYVPGQGRVRVLHKTQFQSVPPSRKRNHQRTLTTNHPLPHLQTQTSHTDSA